MHAATIKALAEVEEYVSTQERLRDATGDDKKALFTEEDIMDILRNGLAGIFKKHAIALAKARVLTITGDTSHLSVKSKIDMLACIDMPRKYDFQPENHNEQEFIRMLENYGMPGYTTRMADNGLLTVAKVTAALKGEESVTLSLGYQGQCYDCGEQLWVTICGTNLHYHTEHGACKSNIVFEVEIDFPTGVVVFGDWPDRFSEMAAAGMLPTKDYDINKLHGMRQATEGYVPYQVFHHFVGNSSPTWYYNKDTQQIQIGSDFVQVGDDEYDMEAVKPEGYTEQGYFCTDLWWVTMIDKQYYDEMLAVLPSERSNIHYAKDVETATIAPGRYRFTAHARINDNDLFATAVRIGDCSGVAPKRDNMAGRRILTPVEVGVMEVWNHHKKHITEAGALSRVEITLDNVFNVLGNGIRNKSEFFDHISIGENEEVPKYAEDDGKDHSYQRDYYPNFQRQFSTIYQMDIADIPTLWLEAAQGFYQRAKAYFLNGAEGYSYAYPNKRDKDDTDGGYTAAFEKYRKEGMSQEEWYAEVSKAYECDYHGDIADFRTRRWEKEKARCIDFCTTAIEDITAELDNRE